MTSKNSKIQKSLENSLQCVERKKAFVRTENKYSSPSLHFIGSWSASTSPARSPPSPRFNYPGGTVMHPNNRRSHPNSKVFGTTSLMQRSRSPSPARIKEMRERDRYYKNEMGTLVNLK